MQTVAKEEYMHVTIQESRQYAQRRERAVNTMKLLYMQRGSVEEMKKKKQ